MKRMCSLAAFLCLVPAAAWSDGHARPPLGLSRNSDGQAVNDLGLQSGNLEAALSGWRRETVTPSQFGAPEDTQRTLVYGVTTTAGSTSAILAATFTAADVGKSIVIAGAGTTAVASAIAASAGTGYAVGDTVTLLGGAVLQKTGNGWAVKYAGSYSTLPANPVTPSSTSGSGTGATFTLTMGANPLQATITAVGASNVLILSTAAGQTLSNATKWVAWGHDDAPAINKALTSASANILLPKQTYGILSPLVLPSNRRISLQCAGSTIVALASMANQMEQNGNGAFNFYASEGSKVSDCRLDGMGVAAQNIRYQGQSWSFENLQLRNAVVVNWLINGKGTGLKAGRIEISNDLSVLPAYPLNNISVGYTDNQFFDIVVQGAGDTAYVDSSSGNYVTNFHAYGFGFGAIYLNGSSAFLHNVYADSIPADGVGFKIGGTYNNVIGWYGYAQTSRKQIGIEIVNADGFNTIVDGSNQGLSATNAIVPAYGQNTTSTNYVANNRGAAFVSIGNSSSICIGYNASCNAQAISLGSFAFAQFGAVAIGSGTGSSQNGSVALGSGAQAPYSGQFSYSPSSNFGQGKNQMGFWVGNAAITNTTKTALTGNGLPASSSNQPTPNINGSLKLQCDMLVHATTGANAAFFQMSVPAIFVRGASGAPTLLPGTGGWSAMAATSGAGTISGGTNSILKPKTAVDAINNTASISLTASSGSWRAQASCQQAEVD